MLWWRIYLGRTQVVENLGLHFIHHIQCCGHLVNTVAECVLNVLSHSRVQLEQLHIENECKHMFDNAQWTSY
jgi:hypothetical protein